MDGWFCFTSCYHDIMSTIMVLTSTALSNDSHLLVRLIKFRANGNDQFHMFTSKTSYFPTLKISSPSVAQRYCEPPSNFVRGCMHMCVFKFLRFCPFVFLSFAFPYVMCTVSHNAIISTALLSNAVFKKIIYFIPTKKIHI